MNEQNNISNAVVLIKTAILQSQARAASAVNQEQLALYYGIGKFISLNTRNKSWGTGAIKQISENIKAELPGIKGFGERNLKNMRTFYEEWSLLESKTADASAEIQPKTADASAELLQGVDSELSMIQPLQLVSLPEFPLTEFLSISFSHHIAILSLSKNLEERLFYIRYCHNYKTTCDELPCIIKKKDLYHHQGKIANNFLSTMPDYKQAFRAIQMFKDEYLLDFINVEELGVRDEEVDERVIENSIVHNVKNFIMTFGKGFAFIGNQVHFDKLGHDHWVDLLFYNRDLERTVVFELKAGGFKVAYLAQLSAYLRILNDDDRRANEKAPIGIILCKEADKTYVEYVMQDFKQPMGVATYKTAEEMDPELLQVLPPKEELQKLLQNASHKEENL